MEPDRLPVGRMERVTRAGYFGMCDGCGDHLSNDDDAPLPPVVSFWLEHVDSRGGRRYWCLPCGSTRTAAKLAEKIRQEIRSDAPARGADARRGKE